MKSELLCVCILQTWLPANVMLYLLGTDLSFPDARRLETERGYLRAKPLVRGQNRPQRTERCRAWEESQSKTLGNWCFCENSGITQGVSTTVCWFRCTFWLRYKGCQIQRKAPDQDLLQLRAKTRDVISRM